MLIQTGLDGAKTDWESCWMPKNTCLEHSTGKQIQLNNQVWKRPSWKAQSFTGEDGWRLTTWLHKALLKLLSIKTVCLQINVFCFYLHFTHCHTVFLFGWFHCTALIWHVNGGVIKQTQRYYYFFPLLNKQDAQNKVPEHCVKPERWQGPPHINRLKQHKIVLSFKVSLFIQSWEQREFAKLVWRYWRYFSSDQNVFPKTT